LAVVVLLALGLWRALESEAVRSFTARRLERAAKTVADVDLEIGDLGWTLVPPRMVLLDVRLEGGVFSAELDQAAVELGALFVARRTIVLDTIEARGIRVVLREGAALEKSSDGSPVRIIIRHLDLKEIDAVGAGLPGGFGLVIDSGKMSWLQDRGEIRGFLSIKNVDLDIPGLEPLSLGVDARFLRRQGGLEAPTVRLTGTDFDLEGAARWNGEALTARLRANLGLEELDRIIRTRSLLEGRITVEADIDTAREAIVEAHLASDRVVVGGFPLEGLQASAEVGTGGLAGRVHQGRLLGGRLEGRYSLGRFAMPFPHEVEATCSGLDLAELLAKLGVPSGGLSSSADITAGVAWNSDRFPEGHGEATVEFHGVEGRLPVTGLLTLGLSPEGLLQFAADELSVGSSRVHLEGPLVVGVWAPEWGIHVEPAQLAEILPAVNQWVGTEVFPEEISGQGKMDIGLSGPWKQLTVGIRMDMKDVRYPPLALDRVVLDASIAGGECRLASGRYRLGSGGGQIEGALRWAPESGEDPLDLQIDGHRLPLDVVASWIDVPHGVVVGEASFTGGLRGSFDDSRGSWALGLAEVEVAGTRVGSGSATVNLRGGVFTASGLNFDQGFEGHVRWDLAEDDLTGDLGWEGMSFEKLPGGLHRLFGHVFDWHASFEWPLADALPMGRLEITGEGSRFSADLDQSGLRASATVDGMASSELEAEFVDDGSSWSGQGEIRVEAVDVLGRQLAPEVSPPLTGSINVPLRFWGQGGQVLGLEGVFEDSELRVGAQRAEIIGDQGFRWDSTGFRLGGLEIDVGGDQVFLRGGIDAEGQLEGNVSGVFDAKLLRVFLPEWEPAGRATGTIEILGQVDTPRLEGIARVERGSFRLPGTRTVVGDVDGSLFLSAGEVALEGLSFKFMRGRGQGRGRILVDGGEAHLRLDGTIEGLDFPLFPGFVPRIDGRWALEGPVDDLELSGDLVVTRGEVRRQDDIASLLMDWFGQVGPPAEDGIRLDLHVRADENLVSRSPFVRLEGSADLNITGTDARPGLVGSIEFMEGGEFTLQGIRYELERGQISFSDPTRVDPMLDFQARAAIREYEVWLSLTGTIDRLVPTVSSDPPLNPAEIYSLMALGQVGQGEAGGAVGMTLASTLLTRRMNEVLGSREQWLLPVDQIRVDPFIESATGDPSARVTVVKQLSPSVTVTLQSNISGDMEEIISARWYLGSGFFVEASRDSRNSDGSYGLDFKMRRRY
jgi:autotransporter translocation and assembly factor TamB